jgi:Divergent InlB B-repeat domain
MRRSFGWTLVLVSLLAASVAFVFVSGASGRPAAGSDCKPYVDRLDATATSDTTAIITAVVESTTGGSWQIHISSPETATTAGTFSGPLDTIQVSLSGLIPHTHYRGTLSLDGECGGTSAEIDFRTPESPPPPTCSAPPGIGALTVGSVAVDSAAVDYTVSSGGDATLHLTVSPGGIDVPGGVSAPGGSGHVPLTGLQPNTQYTVTLTATNACGTNAAQVAFTTLRLTDCSGPPSIGSLRVSAVGDRSARVTYDVESDGATTIEVLVVKARIDVVRQVGPPGSQGTAVLSKLTPATRYLVNFTVTNECGQVSRTRAFTSPGGVTVSVRGSGRVTSDPHGLSCPGAACAGTFGAGTRVRLSAHPRSGFRFARWSGACTGRSPVCIVRAGDTRVTAYFEKR